MARITRERFVEQFRGNSISLQKLAQDSSLAPSVKRDMARADHNGDGFIRGDGEVRALFKNLDNHDRNGSYHSIDTTARGAATPAGLGYHAALSAMEAPQNVQGAGFSDSPQGRFAELLSNNTGLQSNQDLINLFFRRGNNRWDSAASVARHYGQDLNTLTRDRNGRIDRDSAIRAGGGSPSQPSAPSQPVRPSQPAAPVQPTRPVSASGFVTEPGRVSGAFASSRSGREAQATSILKSMGQWPPQEGRAYAIQIDQDAPPASASSSARSGYLRSYSGQTSVFEYKNGRLQEVNDRVYRSASHTGQFNSSLSPDVNRDGRGDIAHIRPGVYNYTTRMHRSGGKRRLNPLDNGEFRNSTRDLNHNGTIDGRERDLNYSATAIQIHEGLNSGPSSIGCQTLHPSDFTKLMSDVREADTTGRRQFTYVLVRRPHDRYGANPF